jgi:GNAT superfamily N-acetyltransferase
VEPSVPPLLLRTLTGAEAGAARRLLALDGAGGLLFGLVDPAGEPGEGPAAAALVVARPGDGTAELRALGVDPRLPREPVAARLLAAVADHLRASGHRRLVVPAGRCPRALAATCLAAGFRLELPL